MEKTCHKKNRKKKKLSYYQNGVLGACRQDGGQEAVSSFQPRKERIRNIRLYSKHGKRRRASEIQKGKGNDIRKVWKKDRQQTDEKLGKHSVIWATWHGKGSRNHFQKLRDGQPYSQAQSSHKSQTQGKFWLRQNLGKSKSQFSTT